MATLRWNVFLFFAVSYFVSRQPLTKTSPFGFGFGFGFGALGGVLLRAQMRRAEVIVDFELNQKLDSVRRTRPSVFTVAL